MANLGPNIVLNNPFAGVTDFGTVTDVFSGENETTETVRPATALEYIARNVDPAHPLYQALIGHSSTSITPYTDVNGNQFYHIAGKTGGPNRERYAQMYAVQGDQLIPVGEGQFYKGEHPDQAFKDFLGVAAGLIAAPVLGPYASAIGNALGITNAAIAQAVGQGIINTSVQVAQGVPIADALKQNIVASVIPNAVGNPIIDNAIRAAASARLMGGDVEKAVTNSLIASGVQSAASDVSITGDRTVDSGLVSGATSSLQAAVTGGDIGQSFVQGYVRGSSTAINQDEARAQRAASGAGFVGSYEDLSGAGPADYVMGERDPALVQAGFFDSARGLAQSALADLGKSWLAAGQQIGIAPQTLQRAIDYLSVIEQGGEALIPDDVKAQQRAFINKIYSVASDPNSTNTEKGRAIIEATLENPLGSLTLVSKEVIQELPQLLIPGRLPAMLGNFVLNIAESAGNQALQKIDELRQANPNMTNEQLVAAARNDAGVAGAVTAAMSLLPGMNTKVLQPAIESFNEFLESGLTTYLLTGDRSKALGDAILGGVIGGKTTTALQTGEQVADAAQQTLPSLGTITVSSTRLPPDQPTVTPGEPLAITPSVVAKTEGGTNIPAPQVSSAVVIRTDPASNTALVIDSTGTTKIVSATDVATGQPVTQGQTLTITPSNTLTSGGGQVVPTGTTPTGGMSALDMQNLLASSQYGQAAQQTLGQPGQQVQQPAGGQLTGVTPVTAGGTQLTAPAQSGGTRPATDTTVRPGQSEADLQQQARLAAEQDIANRTYKGQVYRTAEEAAQARLADTAPTTRPTPAYSANVAATPEIVAELLALKGLPASEGTIRILMTGNPTIAQVGQEIEILTQMRRDQQPTVAATQQPTGTPSVVTGQQTGPTIITDAAQQTKPAIDSKVTQGVATQTATSTAQQSPAEVLINARFTQAGKVASQQDIQNLLNQAQKMGVNLASANVGFTPQYQAWAQLVYDTANDIKRSTPTFVATEPAVKSTGTESLDLTFNTGRVNIDTLEDTGTALDTATGFDTVRAEDTAPTFDTVVDTLPQDTVPTYGEDEDIIKFLGLDQQPTPTTPEITPAEDTIGGGVGGGTVDIPQEEQLAVAPKAVYTPKPGTRVVDTGTSVLPTRVQLSEGMGDDVEGTGEEEQQPVWNVRSLKLRRALGI
jgi:hypothetical protein